MNFDDALNYVHSLLKFGIHPGLDRVGTLLQILGNPHKNIKCIHIAGTNGKGSVSTALSNILEKSGKKVGLYTSPYVTEFLERIQFNNKPIDKSLFAECVEVIKPEIEKMAEKGLQITEFEALTAVAFLCFKKLQVDVLVLEVGLGGRLDATNVIPTPLVNVITSLSLDHTGILGETIEEIAFEKCGTIKENGTVVASAKQDEKALGVIKKITQERNNKLIVPNLNSVTVLKTDIFGTHFIYNDKKYFVKLAGEHQILNMTSVIEAVSILNEKGFDISYKNVYDGLKNTFLPARVEIISDKPLVILDGGHNEDGAKAFYNSVKELIINKKGRLFVLGGMMKDKAVENSLAPLLSEADCFIAVTPENPRAMSAQELSSIAKKHCKDVSAIEKPLEAVSFVKEKITKDDMLFAVGSLYLAGEIRLVLKDLFER